MARRDECVRAIAKQLDCSRNTVRRYLRNQDAQWYSACEPSACKLDAYQFYLRERVSQAHPRWIPATVLMREILAREYVGGISQLKTFLAMLKKTEPEPLVRFEPPQASRCRRTSPACARAVIRCWQWSPHWATSVRATSSSWLARARELADRARAAAHRLYRVRRRTGAPEGDRQHPILRPASDALGRLGRGP